MVKVHKFNCSNGFVTVSVKVLNGAGLCFNGKVLRACFEAVVETLVRLAKPGVTLS